MSTRSPVAGCVHQVGPVELSGPWVRSPGCGAWSRAGGAEESRVRVWAGAEVMEKRPFRVKERQ